MTGSDDRLLDLENQILGSMITIRYAFDDPAGNIDQRHVATLKRKMDRYISVAESLKAARNEDPENER